MAGLTFPYQQRNFMGNFAGDAACEAEITARGWTLSAGMTYMDIALDPPRMKFYDGTNWKLYAIVP